jgi:hypothetical protein
MRRGSQRHVSLCVRLKASLIGSVANMGLFYYGRKDRARRIPPERGIPRRIELRQNINTIVLLLQSNDYYIACAVTSNTLQGNFRNCSRWRSLKPIWVKRPTTPKLPKSRALLYPDAILLITDANLLCTDAKPILVIKVPGEANCPYNL